MQRMTMILAIFAGMLLTTNPLSAHCDALNGPVVTAARKALESGNVNLVLNWVREGDEPAIRDAFNKTLAVRRLGPGARDLADMFFYETLVRIHRAGEGVAYTGLKPGGAEIEPGIAMADEALLKGSVQGLLAHIDTTVAGTLHALFTEAVNAGKYHPDDVAAGRRYVEAYVTFIHYAEGVVRAASMPHPGGQPAGTGEERPASHAH